MNARVMYGVDGLGYVRPPVPACPPFCQRHDIHAEFGDAHHYGAEVGVPVGDDALSVCPIREDQDGRAGEPHVYLSGLDDVSVELTAEQARQLGLALIDASIDVASATRGGAR